MNRLDDNQEPSADDADDNSTGNEGKAADAPADLAVVGCNMHGQA